jgi:hypothetical protein
MRAMKNIAWLAICGSLVAGAFVSGMAVGKGAADVKFVATEEVKWDDVGGPKLGNLWGDYKKGPYGALMKLPAGFTSPLHTHSADYEAIQVQGTSSHWLKGEDGSKAKKMTPGSYWKMPGKLEHVSSCAPGADCIIYLWQTKKFDFTAIDAATKAPPMTPPPGAKSEKATTPAPATGKSTTPAPATGKATTPAPTTPAPTPKK